MATAADTLLLRTKLHPPQLDDGRVARPRLLESFCKHPDCLLTLVAAPAGYGKSILVAEWTVASGRPSAWICLDDSDNDLQLFVRYLVAAVESMFPESCPQTSSLIEAAELPSVRVLAGQLANEMDAIGEPCTLVLDDYHEIRESAIHDLVGELLRHPPSNVHWVIATRRDPPLPLASLRASYRMNEIRFADLKFSADETALLMGRIFGQALSEATMARIAELSEGWVAGLQLVGLAARYQPNPELFLSGLSGSIREIQDYLISEVLSRETPEFRRCILKTSVVERFSASFCEGVCDHSSDCPLAGEGMMKRLDDTGAFMIPLDPQGEWYRYHHLFRDLLRRQLKKEMSGEEIADLHTRASHWFEGLESIEEAIAHALKGGDPEAAAAIVEEHRRHEFNEDRWHVVERWLRLLPSDIVSSRPRLLLCEAIVAHCRFQVEKIPALIERAESLLTDQVAEPSVLGEIAYLRGIVEYWTGEAEQSRRHFEEALSLAGELRSIGAEAELMLGLAQCMCGEKTASIEGLEKRIREIDRAEIYLNSRLVAGLVFIHLITGNPPRARSEAEHLWQLVKGNGLRNTEAWASYFLGCAHLQANDLDAAATHFSAACEHPYVLETRAFFDAAGGLALTRQLLGHSDAAAEAVKELEEFAREQGDHQYLPMVHSCRARISLLRGDLPSAIKSASLISEEPSPAGLFLWLIVPPLTKARVLIASGSPRDLREATDLLQEIRSMAESCHFTGQTIEVSVLEALLLEKNGRTEDALTAMQSALALAKPGGFIRPFTEAGAALAPLLKRIVQMDGDSGFVPRILSIVDGAETDKKPRQTDQPLIEPLTVREIDVLQLVAKRLYDKEIADQLSISPGTVKTHLKHIYRKLDVGNRRHAAERAQELGIL